MKQRSTRIVRKFCYVVAHPRRHWALQRVLAAARRDGLVSATDRTLFKYLDNYLAGHLTTAARAELIASHYRFLLDELPAPALRRRWAEGGSLWERVVGDDRYRIMLERSTVTRLEGESQLSFLRNDERLFTMTFAVVGGSLMGLGGDYALFVGGLQGAGCRQAARTASRDNGEIAPAAMLLLAARAVAAIFGIEHIAGITGADQAARLYSGDLIRFCYDGFWQQQASQRVDGGFYVLPVVTPGDRDLSHLSSAHRARARRKARYKAAVQEEIQASIRAQFASA